MPRRKSVEKQIADLKKATRGKRINWSVPGIVGLYVRVTDQRSKSFWIVARGPEKQVWAKVPFHGDLERLSEDDMDAVRVMVREGIANIKRGDPAFAASPEPDTFKAIAENWVKRHVRANKLITAAKIERTLERLVYPNLGKKPIGDIKRSDIVALLDKIEDENGATMADRTLENIRSVLNWHEARDDDFVNPIRRGMARTKPHERRRKRVLDDHEIRLLWSVCEESGTPGAIVQMLLLSAQRLEKVQQMRWDDIDREGVWTIPEKDPREKANAQTLPLPAMAIGIIEKQPRIVGNPYVFASTRTDRYFNGINKAKSNLDKALLAALKTEAAENGEDPRKVRLKPWVLHTLRHTAKTLMARAGVPDFDSERVLGHVVPGIGGVYDHHRYTEAKGVALEKLAALVDRIVDPPAEGANVVELRQGAD